MPHCATLARDGRIRVALELLYTRKNKSPTFFIEEFDVLSGMFLRVKMYCRTGRCSTWYTPVSGVLHAVRTCVRQLTYVARSA